MLIQNIKILVRRCKKGEETFGTLFARIVLLPNKLRLKPVKVFEEKWDYLIVLDACRFDCFEKINKIPGKLSCKVSAATHTSEWAQKNFKGKCDDVVYISANPQVSPRKLSERIDRENPFLHLENVWTWGWDDYLNTVHPQQVNDAVMKMLSKFPGRKMVIHYLQPHFPFIGQFDLQGKEMSMKVSTARWWKMQLDKGEFTIEELKRAYEDNLVLVLEHVEKLIANLRGTIVITADHGESFGTMGVYGHPPLMLMKDLYHIPWLVIEK